MSRRIDARCPVCREWHRIEEAVIGAPIICVNCKQQVVPVPRSTTARSWRIFARVLIVLGGLALCAWLYESRVASMADALGGPAMPGK